MKKLLTWGAIAVVGLMALGAVASHGTGSGSGGTVSSASGWTMVVTGARGIQADCTWDVMQGGSSHSGSRTVTAPATIRLGDADIISANCQKKEDGARLLQLRLHKDGALAQKSEATTGYGIASVSGS